MLDLTIIYKYFNIIVDLCQSFSVISTAVGAVFADIYSKKDCGIDNYAFFYYNLSCEDIAQLVRALA